MLKGSFSRLTAGLILLGVLFTQAGLNLLHAHKGLPDHQIVTLSDSPENGGAPCQVCAMEGVASPLFAETNFFFLPEFTSTPFVEVGISGNLLPVSTLSAGRAPPLS